MNGGKLQFGDLSDRHDGVSKKVADFYEEAARVCLGRHHSSPQAIQLLDGSKDFTCDAEWSAPDERTKRAWANETDATTNGAYGIALAAIEITRGLVAVSRAATRTGSDYYLGEKGRTPPTDLEASVRLEISGTDKGNDGVMRARVREKMEQARRGDDNLPAIASVVGFLALKVMASDV